MALERNGPVGRVLPLEKPFTVLWPHQRHATLPWQGERLVLVGFHVSFIARLSAADRNVLVESGFFLEGRH